MKIIRIQYTVQAGFAEQNKKNVAAVMADLQTLNHPGIRYSAYTLEDGKTFMHFVMFRDEEAEKAIRDRQPFQHFQSELKASGPEVPPKFDNLALVGASYALFE